MASACGVTAGAAQSGLLAQQTDPDPDGPGPGPPRAQQFLYDATGRQVGRRVGPAATIATAPWACTSYDLRGRVTSQSWPATATAPARTVGYTYGVGGNPLVSSVADPAGTVRSIVDLLGRVTTYTDVWDKTTTVSYDRAGRATTTAGPQGVVTQAYDPNTSKPSTLTRNGTVLASAGYGSDRLGTVVYANSTGLSVGYDLLGRRNSLSFTGAAGRLVAHEVTISPGGRRTGQLIDTGGPGLVDPNPAGDDLVYDGAGRLTTAFLNGARADYGYGTNLAGEGCANPTMGADTNRTSVTTTPTGGPATVTRSCYDKADRLVSTTAGGGPVSTAYGYDGHGNATTDAATTLSYDAADRLTGLASGTTTVRYVRDALDRVVSRTEGATVTRYAHGGFSDTAVAVLDGTSVPLQIPLALPGGPTLTVQGNGGDVWSYPDLAGHLVATANSTGTRQGPPVTYDPWGAEYPARPPIDNANGNADYAAFGSASKLEEHATPTPIVLMGARPYAPTQARFLSVDPVEGGCANAYTYVFGDPVNTNDLSGKRVVPPCAPDASVHCGFSLGYGGPYCQLNLSPNKVGELRNYVGLTGAVVPAAGAVMTLLGIGGKAAAAVSLGIIAHYVLFSYKVITADLHGEGLSITFPFTTIALGLGVIPFYSYTQSVTCQP